jgi:hypothetical protein
VSVSVAKNRFFDYSYNSGVVVGVVVGVPVISGVVVELSKK